MPLCRPQDALDITPIDQDHAAPSEDRQPIPTHPRSARIDGREIERVGDGLDAVELARCARDVAIALRLLRRRRARLEAALHDATA